MRSGSLRYSLIIAFLSLCAVAVFLRPLSGIAARLARYSPAIKEGSGTLQQVFQSSGFSFAPTPEMRICLDLSYPQEMRENQTGTVSLQYSIFEDEPSLTGGETTELPWPTLPLSSGAALSSSGFDIAPSQFIKKAPTSQLPVSFVWTLTPRREGDHVLLLDVSLLTSSWQWPVAVLKGRDTQRISLTLNERTSDLPPGEVVELPVRVATIWGVPQTTVQLIRAAIGLAAFVLLYPVFVDWIKARSRTRSARDQSAA